MWFDCKSKSVTPKDTKVDEGNAPNLSCLCCFVSLLVELFFSAVGSQKNYE